MIASNLIKQEGNNVIQTRHKNKLMMGVLHIIDNRTKANLMGHVVQVLCTWYILMVNLAMSNVIDTIQRTISIQPFNVIVRNFISKQAIAKITHN